MSVDEVKNQLEEQGLNPNDFHINKGEYGYSIIAKPYVEFLYKAKREDKPIIEDVNDVAELTTITAMDKDELAEMLVYALQRIDELEVRING